MAQKKIDPKQSLKVNHGKSKKLNLVYLKDIKRIICIYLCYFFNGIILIFAFFICLFVNVEF